MRITIHPLAGSTGSSFLLGDEEEREFVDGFMPDQTREVQIGVFPRAASVTSYGRGNRKNTLVFTVSRVHDTKEEAFGFSLTHPEDVPDEGIIEINHESTTRWLRNAVIANVRCVKIIGASTWFSYTIIGGELLVARPTT